jgi:hypothetical protein
MHLSKIVKLNDDSHVELNEIGSKGESSDVIIKRLIWDHQDKKERDDFNRFKSC